MFGALTLRKYRCVTQNVFNGGFVVANNDESA
jgi:hypothetical protein